MTSPPDRPNEPRSSPDRGSGLTSKRASAGGGVIEFSDEKARRAKLDRDNTAEKVLRFSNTRAMLGGESRLSEAPVDEQTRTYIDSKIEVAQAKSDARFAEMLARIETMGAGLSGRIDALGGRIDALGGRIDGLAGRIDGVEHRIDGLPSRGSVALNVWGAAGTIFALMLAAFAIWGDAFGTGLSVSPLAAQATADDSRMDRIESAIAANADQIAEIAKRLDQPAPQP